MIIQFETSSYSLSAESLSCVGEFSHFGRFVVVAKESKQDCLYIWQVVQFCEMDMALVSQLNSVFLSGKTKCFCLAQQICSQLCSDNHSHSQAKGAGEAVPQNFWSICRYATRQTEIEKLDLIRKIKRIKFQSMSHRNHHLQMGIVRNR